MKFDEERCSFDRAEQHLITKICLVYLDDVIVFGKIFEEMVSNLRQIPSLDFGKKFKN